MHRLLTPLRCFLVEISCVVWRATRILLCVSHAALRTRQAFTHTLNFKEFFCADSIVGDKVLLLSADLEMFFFGMIVDDFRTEESVLPVKSSPYSLQRVAFDVWRFADSATTTEHVQSINSIVTSNCRSRCHR